MKEKDIIDAYLKIRKIDNTIPDEVLDFMKNSAIEKLSSPVVEKPMSSKEGFNQEHKNLLTLKNIVDESFWIFLNANDFFGYACADGIELDSLDLKWIIPVVQKYPKYGLGACMSYIRQCQPIEPHITEEFKQAYKELEELKPKVWSENYSKTETK